MCTKVLSFGSAFGLLGFALSGCGKSSLKDTSLKDSELTQCLKELEEKQGEKNDLGTPLAAKDAVLDVAQAVKRCNLMRSNYVEKAPDMDVEDRLMMSYQLRELTKPLKKSLKAMTNQTPDGASASANKEKPDESSIVKALQLKKFVSYAQALLETDLKAPANEGQCLYFSWQDKKELCPANVVRDELFNIFDEKKDTISAYMPFHILKANPKVSEFRKLLNATITAAKLGGTFETLTDAQKAEVEKVYKRVVVKNPSGKVITTGMAAIKADHLVGEPGVIAGRLMVNDLSMLARIPTELKELVEPKLDAEVQKKLDAVKAALLKEWKAHDEPEDWMFYPTQEVKGKVLNKLLKVVEKKVTVVQSIAEKFGELDRIAMLQFFTKSAAKTAAEKALKTLQKGSDADQYGNRVTDANEEANKVVGLLVAKFAELGTDMKTKQTELKAALERLSHAAPDKVVREQSIVDRLKDTIQEMRVWYAEDIEKIMTTFTDKSAVVGGLVSSVQEGIVGFMDAAADALDETLMTYEALEARDDL